jgi:hypothetical protein
VNWHLDADARIHRCLPIFSAAAPILIPNTVKSPTKASRHPNQRV